MSGLDLDLKFVNTAIQLTIDGIFNRIQILSESFVPAPVRYILKYNYIRTKCMKSIGLNKRKMKWDYNNALSLS